MRLALMSEFANNCPDHCPPTSASDVSGDVYRFVRNDPVAASDMRSWEDDDIKPGCGDKCQRCALSVLRKVEDVRSARQAIPLFRKWKVARALLNESHGKLAQTGSHRWHYSLWVRTAHRYSIHQLFAVEPA